MGETSFATTAEVGAGGTSGWYEREENNGWRAVTVRATDELKQDSVETRPCKTKNTYHMFGLGKSRAEREREAKTKKRQWLRQMYTAGLAKETEPGKLESLDRLATIHSNLLETSHGNTFVAHLDMAGVRQEEGFDGDGDVEVEKLLEWTKELDFDEYMDDWRQLGTSEISGGRGGRKEVVAAAGGGEEAKDEFFNYGLS